MKNPQFESFCAHADSVAKIPIEVWWGTGERPPGLRYEWLNRLHYVAIQPDYEPGKVEVSTFYEARLQGTSYRSTDLHKVEKWLYECLTGQIITEEAPAEPNYALPHETQARVIDPDLEKGTYPEDKYRYRTLMPLADQQILLLAEDEILFRDLNNQPTCEFTSRWLKEAMVNKGYFVLPGEGDLAIYNHDGTLYLIQILGAKLEAPRVWHWALWAVPEEEQGERYLVNHGDTTFEKRGSVPAERHQLYQWVIENHWDERLRAAGNSPDVVLTHDD